MTRVFLGIPLSQELKNEIQAWQKKHIHLPVRWIAGKNMHITLVPPWEETDPDAALEKLEEVAKTAPKLSIQFTNISFGPHPRDPRLIWAYGRAPVELITLAETTHRVMSFDSPRREFTLHTTLARFRPDEFRSFPTQDIHQAIDWKMKIEKISLFESILRPEGADYKVLGEVNF